MSVAVITGTKGESMLLSDDDGDMCLRISAAHGSDPALLDSANALATFAYTACEQAPPPALDGHDYWAMLYTAARDPKTHRPKAHLIFYERVDVPGAPPSYVNRPVLDLAWHVLLDRATRRFRVPPPALDAACAALRAHAAALLAAQGAALPAPPPVHPSLRWDAWRDPNAAHGRAQQLAYARAAREHAWARARRETEAVVAKMREKAAARAATPVPGARRAYATRHNVPDVPDFVEFPDQEEGYDGGDPCDPCDEDEQMPPSDEDWYYCRDIEWDEPEL